MIEEKYKKFNFIFETVAGSQLYGTSTPESDIDIRGVFIPTREYLYSFLYKIEQIEYKSNDITYFDIRKFCHLASQCNPNIIELLFVPEKMATKWTEDWRCLLNSREAFLSKKARYSFSGYAVSQLHRIKQHRNWLLNPPRKQPERSDFGLPNERKLVTAEQFNALMELAESFNMDVVSEFGLDTNTMEILQREKAFQNANKYWGQYMNWKNNRNPQRAVLEEKFGYDTKHAMHLYRLITEGEELLTQGAITFPRPGARLLLDIRNGVYSYDELMNEIGDLDLKFGEFYDKSSLPYSPDIKRCDGVCQELVSNFVNERR